MYEQEGITAASRDLLDGKPEENLQDPDLGQYLLIQSVRVC